MIYSRCYVALFKMENLPKELKEKLEKFAKQRANEVEDVSIDEFIQCVLDGALWMYSNAI